MVAYLMAHLSLKAKPMYTNLSGLLTHLMEEGYEVILVKDVKDNPPHRYRIFLQKGPWVESIRLDPKLVDTFPDFLYENLDEMYLYMKSKVV